MLTLRLDGTRDPDLRRASALLLQGGTVAVPTETVYGLAARGLVDDAVARIYAAKGRPQDNPVILHVNALEAALPLWDVDDDVVRARIERLAAAFWPGPLTIVAPRSALVSDRATAGLAKVAVRVPAHPIMRALLDVVGEPLAAPSANASGRPSPTSADDVLESLDGKIDAVLDGGRCDVGVESTVVDVTGPVPVILRPGAVGEDALRALLDDVIVRAPGLLAHADEASPGLRHRHYAPLIDEVRLVDGEAVRAAWSSSAAVLARRATALGLPARAAPTELLDDTPEGFARELYAALYRLERQRPARLLVEEPPREAAWRAVLDRVLRACA